LTETRAVLMFYGILAAFLVGLAVLLAVIE
jgi:hypothetical protein